MQTAELMAGRELDALLALRVMGWTLVPSIGPYEWSEWHDQSDQTKTAGSLTNSAGFKPSTEIAAAWTVVEKLNTDGYGLEITQYPNGEARVVVMRGYAWVTDLNAETTPLAICRAALAAVGH